MKLRSAILFVCLCCFLSGFAWRLAQQPDSLHTQVPDVIDTDSLLQRFSKDTAVTTPVIKTQVPKPIRTIRNRRNRSTMFEMRNKHAFDSILIARKASADDSLKAQTFPGPLIPVHIDSAMLQANPFFIDLTYISLPLYFNWNLPTDFRTIANGDKIKTLNSFLYQPQTLISPEGFLWDLRQQARKTITRTAVNLYAYTFDQLPNPDGNKSHVLNGKRIERVQFIDDDELSPRNRRKLNVQKAQLGPWFRKGDAKLQFSQNYVSANWYQGGSSNLAILGIFAGQLNYDNKKYIQWENSLEWRAGFNSVSGDTLRTLNTNEDVFKIYSKIGVKAGGNWYYSSSIDFSTQIFNSFKSVNSPIMKTTFLTPVRVNIGVGLDYKYKKVFSLMLSPISFKYIYVNKTKNIDVKLFGIKEGDNLKEIGSQLKAQLALPITREIQLDSKFSFYTNYEKVEIDWEVVCNFTINRFLSTRVSFNPRYDNTAILKNGDHSDIQFKQLLSVGFSHKF